MHVYTLSSLLPRPIINKRPGYEVSVHTVMRELKVAQSEVPVTLVQAFQLQICLAALETDLEQTS